jgi:hypothetical protein
MRRILPLLALAACTPPPATGPSRSGRGDGAAGAGEAREDPPAPATAELAALVPHLAPGDPVTLAIRFSREVGTVARIDPLDAVLARPDGTTQRARIAVSFTPGSDVYFTVPAAAGLDLALAGRYQLSLAGVAHGAGADRFVTREIELEVMGDGRLPLADIERRARRELARRYPGVTPDNVRVFEGPDGMRAVLFAAGDALRFVRVTPGGEVLPADTTQRLLWAWPAP